jgi:monothiol glutaredoxin
MKPELRKEIDELINNNRVVLFMKGAREMPRCGFSARVVEILDQVLDEYRAIDVLSRPDIWKGVREYTNWPTIPQLYVDGHFVGGCDIVSDLASSGELYGTLGVERPSAAPAQSSSSHHEPPAVPIAPPQSAGPVQTKMESRLREAFDPSHLDVVNESYKHSVPADAESHFKVTVISDAFDGREAVERHRAVQQALGEKLGKAVHALSIEAWTPREWARRGRSTD